MKKIMIAMSAVCLAAFAHAATATWSASNIAYAPSSAAEYSAFLIDNDVGGYADYDAAVAAILANGASATGVIASKDGLSDSGTKLALASSGTALVDNGYTAGQSIEAMMIIFDAAVDDIANAQNYMGATKSAAKFNNSLALNAGFGTQAANTWTSMAVPEPTSALLMLLGVAGLALRRRRA